MVRSVLEYGDTVWNPYLKKDCDQLDKVQRRAARFVYNNYSRYTSVTSLLNKLQWKTLSDRRREDRLVLMYKIINDLIAIPAENYITHSKYTRTSNSKKINLYSCKTDIYKNSFFPKSVRDWNNLCDSCVLSDSVDAFKGGLRGLEPPSRD
jgi:hypothetical protein